jgi:hypothetical protein
LNWKKSFLSPQATIMENKAPQDTTAKSSLGLLIVEGGFDDQVCVIPCYVKDRINGPFLGWRVGVVH